MNFTEALKALCDGKYIVRESFSDKTTYLAYMPGMNSVWQILVNPNPNAGNYLFKMDDYLANDWKIFEKAEEKEAS